MKKLTDERYEEIKKAAADLLEKANIHKIPIDPLQIATAEGIKLIPYSYFPQKKRTLLLLASEDGFCCRDGLQEIIYFNDEGRCYERIRQTIMHEIGHIVLEHAGGIIDYCLESTGNDVIPAVGWMDEDSFEWCFDGLPERSSLAISTNGCKNEPLSRHIFFRGIEELFRRLNPTHLIICGKVLDELPASDKILYYPPHGLYAEVK